MLKGLYFQKMRESKYKLIYRKQENVLVESVMHVSSDVKCENGQFVLSEDEQQDILQCVDIVSSCSLD